MRTAVAVLAVALTGPAVARADAFIPPMKADYGAAVNYAGGERLDGRQALIGLSLATVLPRDLPFDVGLGYVTADTFPAIHDAPVARMQPPPASLEPTRLHGGYLEGAVRLVHGKGWRSWATTRVELGAVDGGRYVGTAGRLTVELWGGLRGGCDGGPGGIFGVAAIGGYVEIGARGYGDRGTAFGAAGIEVRVPMVGPGGRGGCCR